MEFNILQANPQVFQVSNHSFICLLNKGQFHKITGLLRLEGTSQDHLAPPPVQTQSATIACPATFPVRFWLSPWMQLDNFSGQPTILFSHVYTKIMFSYALMEFHVFQLVPILSSSVTDNHCKESGSLFVPLSHQVFLSPLFFRLYSFSSLSPSSHKRYFRHLMLP